MNSENYLCIESFLSMLQNNRNIVIIPNYIFLIYHIWSRCQCHLTSHLCIEINCYDFHIAYFCTNSIVNLLVLIFFFQNFHKNLICSYQFSLLRSLNKANHQCNYRSSIHYMNYFYDDIYEIQLILLWITQVYHHNHIHRSLFSTINRTNCHRSNNIPMIFYWKY